MPAWCTTGPLSLSAGNVWLNLVSTTICRWSIYNTQCLVTLASRRRIQILLLIYLLTYSTTAMHFDWQTDQQSQVKCWYIHSLYESHLTQRRALAASCWMWSQDQVDRSRHYQTCTICRQLWLQRCAWSHKPPAQLSHIHAHHHGFMNKLLYTTHEH